MAARISDAVAHKLGIEGSKEPKPSKYRNKRVTVDGIRFDSMKEADRWRHLKAREEAGEISHLEVQPKFYFVIKGESVKYPSGRRAHYRGDFAYMEGERRVVEDSKGFRTDIYKLKRALVEHIYPAVKIVEV